jgi:hypothetical protein
VKRAYLVKIEEHDGVHAVRVWATSVKAALARAWQTRALLRPKGWLVRIVLGVETIA